MKRLPKDIEDKIDKLFRASADNREIKKIILSLWSTSLNVGPEQLARSILTISEGDVEELKNIFQQKFYGDPRDVIMTAESKVGNPKHYFIPTFEEIENGK